MYVTRQILISTHDCVSYVNILSEGSVQHHRAYLIRANACLSCLTNKFRPGLVDAEVRRSLSARLIKLCIP